MKISFHNVNFGSSSGPNTFCTRLAKQLAIFGHTLVSPSDICDIDLINITTYQHCRGKIQIQRLDGIWTRINDDMLNEPIKKIYSKANHVIWQSQYDKNLIETLWGNKNGSVIHNGSSFIDKLDFNLINQIREIADVIFCSSASWHPQKRLQANINAMRAYAKNTNKKCALFVLGDVKNKIAGADIFYVGSVDEKYYFNIYSASDALIHLAWRDHCPNVCVEALRSGTPIVCASSGGTPELLYNNDKHGIIIDDSLNYTKNNLIFNFDEPPEINVEHFNTIPQKQFIDITNYTIEHIAKMYENLFLELLNAK